MKVKIKIDGMTCNHCKERVTNLISEFDGVSNVTVDLEDGIAEFECKDFDEKFYREELDDIGFDYVGLVE